MTISIVKPAVTTVWLLLLL